MLAVKQQEESGLASRSAVESASVAKQLVDLEILYLLTFSPKSGYELRKHLLNWFRINISYGTLYPHLHALEKSGLVIGNWQQKFEEAPLKKRMYSLTPTGQRTLRANIESLAKISLTMEFMLTQVGFSSHADLSISQEQRSALNLVEGFLSSRGYTVRKLALVKGYSGREYPVDLFANRQDMKSSIALRFSEKADVSIDDVLKMSVISFELQSQRSIILSPVMMVSENARKLASFCHVAIYSGHDFENAATNLNSMYDEPLA